MEHCRRKSSGIICFRIYLYLKDYVKIFAAIIQKADDFEQIRFLSGELADTIGETFRTHIPYMKRASRFI